MSGLKARRAPEPRKAIPALAEPVRKLLLCYKVTQGYKIDDTEWDRVYFRRLAEHAKDLIAVFGGDYQLAVMCLGDLGDQFTQKGFTWTLNTIITHAAEWRYKNAQPDKA